MTLLYTVEKVRLTLRILLFLILHILPLDLGKGNSHLILPVSLPKTIVPSIFCYIVVQQFHDYKEVLRVPVYTSYVDVFELSIDFFVPQVV